MTQGSGEGEREGGREEPEERKSFHQPTTTNSSTNNCVGKRIQSVNWPCLSQRYRSSASRVTRPRRAPKNPTTCDRQKIQFMIFALLEYPV